MRAKVKCTEVDLTETYDQVTFTAVCKSGSYPADGMDEDNTFSKFSPSPSSRSRSPIRRSSEKVPTRPESSTSILSR